LSRFYPACGGCPHAADAAPLSARRIAQLAETSLRGQPRPLFHREGAGGVYLNDLGPQSARKLAAAMGLSLRDPAAVGRVDGPVVVLAGDGRPLTCEIVAAAGEGLRWAGCRVVDIGAATSACLGFAVDHLKTDGGLLVGNPGHQPHVVGLTFWRAGASPLSDGEALDRIRELYAAPIDRPTRVYGALRRFQAAPPYLAVWAEYYHAMRPLRLVLDSASAPLVGYLARLTEAVACEVVARRTTRDRFPDQVAAEHAHFGVRIDGDGERCDVFDERGRPVPPDRLLALVAQHRRASAGSRAAVVLERDAAPAVAQAIGEPVATSDPRRSEMASAMRRSAAVVGGGPSGRFWYADHGPPLPDALGTVTSLLSILSASDRHLSEALG
jgi:phosphomannomutase